MPTFAHQPKSPRQSWMSVDPRAPMGLQRRLTLNTPGDVYEQEADRVAARVMHMPETSLQPTGLPTEASRPAGAREALAPPVIGETSRGAGRPLDASARGFFEPRFGHDFGRVRVHTDPQSARSADLLGASAYTVGADIVFAHGRYAPDTRAGRTLLAHELTHVVQQREQPAAASLVQRSITLTAPEKKIPDPTVEKGDLPRLFPVPSDDQALPTRASALEGWLAILCPDGKWKVDTATGVVDSPDHGAFCGARPAPGQVHHTTSAHPTSCGCLCELTAPGARRVEMQIDEYLTVGDKKHPLEQSGEGQTSIAPNDDRVVAVSGRGLDLVPGAGATQPSAGAGRSQTIPMPPWLILGHELCGHGRIKTELPDLHMTSLEGNRSAVDVENRIRREHSTVTSSLGMRRGEINVNGPDGKAGMRFGGSYRVGASETLSEIAVRCGIPVADMLNHTWRLNGDRIPAEDQGSIKAGDDLLIEGIDWHEVIRGENMSAIARIWAVPLSSLERANPRIKGPSFIIRPGDRLLIPAS